MSHRHSTLLRETEKRMVMDLIAKANSHSLSWEQGKGYSIAVLPTLYPKVEVFVDVRERVETIVALPAVTLFLKALDTNAESKAL